MRLLGGGLLIAALGASGCASHSTVDDDAQPAAATPVTLSLSLSGLGQINERTRFSENALRSALPAYDVEAAQYRQAAAALAVLLVTRNGQPIAEVFADASGQRVGRIDVVGANIAGPQGQQTGIRLAEANIPQLRCTPGRGELAGSAVCGSANDQRVIYVFEHGEDDESALPPRDVLADATLKRMVWTPA